MPPTTSTTTDAEKLAAVRPMGNTVAAFTQRGTFVPMPPEHVPIGLGQYAHAECVRLEAMVKQARADIGAARNAATAATKKHESDTLKATAEGASPPERIEMARAATAVEDAEARKAALMKMRGEAVGRLHRLMMEHREEYLATVGASVAAVLADLEEGAVTHPDAVRALEGLLSGAQRYSILDASAGAIIGTRVAAILLPAHNAADALPTLRLAVEDMLGRAIPRKLGGGGPKPGTEPEGAPDALFASR